MRETYDRKNASLRYGLCRVMGDGARYGPAHGIGSWTRPLVARKAFEQKCQLGVCYEGPEIVIQPVTERRGVMQ